MWQRFTERARRVILLASEEAAKMNSSHVGTEHLLLGLVRENEGVAAQVLQKMGVSLQRVRQEIEAEVEQHADQPAREPKLTRQSKHVLETAADEARRMRHNYIGTEHLLLALVREKDGVAAKVLGKLGLDLEKARNVVMEYLAPDEEPSPQKQDEPGKWPAFPLLDLLSTVFKAPEPQEANPKSEPQAEESTGWILLMLMRLLPRELREMGSQLRRVNREKEAAALRDDYETAATLRNEAALLEQRMEEFAEMWAQKINEAAPLPSAAALSVMPAIVENLIVQIEAAIDALSAGDAEKIAEVKQRLATLKNELRGE